MRKIKHVEVEYIESGTYVGSEEASYGNDLGKIGKYYVVISPEDWEYIQEQLHRIHDLEK